MSLSCTVCYEVFVPTENISAAPCGHVLHYKCWTDWLQRSGNCPDCRHETRLHKLIKLYFGAGDGNDYATLRNKYDAVRIDLVCKTNDCDAAEKTLKYYEGEMNALREEINRLLGENDKLKDKMKRSRTLSPETEEEVLERVRKCKELSESMAKQAESMAKQAESLAKEADNVLAKLDEDEPVKKSDKKSRRSATVGVRLRRRISFKETPESPAMKPKPNLAKSPAKSPKAGPSKNSKPSPAKKAKPSPAKKTIEKPQTSRSCVGEQPAKRISLETYLGAKRQKLSDAAKRYNEDSDEPIEEDLRESPVLGRRNVYDELLSDEDITNRVVTSSEHDNSSDIHHSSEDDDEDDTRIREDDEESVYYVSSGEDIIPDSDPDGGDDDDDNDDDSIARNSEDDNSVLSYGHEGISVRRIPNASSDSDDLSRREDDDDDEEDSYVARSEEGDSP